MSSESEWPLARVSVKGNDALPFLQRQLTCDLDGFDVGQSRFGAWCDVKGRVVATLLVERREWLDLVFPPEMFEPLIGGLRRFVLRDDVRFSDPVPQSGLTRSAPSATGQPGTADSPTRLPGEPSRWAWFGPSPAGGMKASAAWYWEIMAGIPWVTQRTSGKFLPQMLGLEALGALSYRKGCYPGQEIVARAHFLGKVKRGLYRGHMERAPMDREHSDGPAVDALGPGTPVTLPDGASAGEVLLAAATEQGGADLLLILSEVVLAQGNERLTVADSGVTVHRGGEPGE